MQMEFYTPRPGCFKGTTFFRELDSKDWKPIEQLDENSQRLIFELMRDNRETNRHIKILKSHGITSITEILQHIIPKVWGRITPLPDIDGTKLNFETIKR